MKSTKSEIIAQLWMYSCDAPDSDDTAKEVKRLAKMIDDVLAGKEPKWKIVNRSLRYLDLNKKKERYHLGNVLRGWFSGEFLSWEEAWKTLSKEFDKSFPSEQGRQVYMYKEIPVKLDFTKGKTK